MLFLVKIIVFSLFVICCFHYFYEKFTEKICNNGNTNKNRVEYHTSKYKKILNDISIATNTFENKFNGMIDAETSAKSIAEVPLFDDVEKQTMYDELMQII